jgi:hypothetical protein
MEITAFFADWPESAKIFEALRTAVENLGETKMRVTKSQIAFRRRTGFAWAWVPGRYLGGNRPPLVLSIALRHRDPSLRWKQVVEPARGRFMHHLELTKAADLDDQVRLWLHEAWVEAG